MLKHELMDEAFAINDNTNLKKIQNVRIKLRNYLKDHGEDYQIRNVIIMLDIFVIENKYEDYGKCYEIAESVFETLSKIDKWDFYDIRAIVPLIDYCSPDFEQIDYQANIILQKLEDYSHENRYHPIKSAIHMNMLFRLLRIRFLERIDMQNKEVVRRLENTFLKHYNAIQNHNVFNTL